MNVFIYDLETYPNFFLASFKSIENNKFYEFEISDRKNEIKKLRIFLYQNNLKLIGYNNLNFDYPILHNTILKNNNNFTSYEIYNEVQKVIESEYSSIWNNFIKIPQIDLYKIWHYDNNNRRTSLKWLEFSMRFHNVEDLPYKIGQNLTNEEKDITISYCRNDLNATHEFFKLSSQQISFRKQMSIELNHDIMNYSDVKIGEYINRITYEKLSNKKYKNFKEGRTYRSSFEIKYLIPNYISFKTKYMQNFLNDIRNKSFKNTEDFNREITIGNMKMKFAKGGLHSIDEPKDITINSNQILQEKDVRSMYPSSIINGKFYPLHLGKEWYLGIKKLFEERAYVIKPEMENHSNDSNKYKYLDAKQGAYKLAMNGGGYGKTGSLYSWQYDPLVIMKTTFKGQLSLLMLIEELDLIGVELISANTDGVVIKYNKNIKHLVDDIHKKWEIITSYILEDTNYNRIIFRDVNNFIAFINNNNIIKYKFKGAYEIDRDYHKNHSKRIISICAANYFINNIKPEKTILNHFKGINYDFCNNYGIYDFCLGNKAIGGNRLIERNIIKNKIIDKKLGKVNRYYVSNKGNELIKKLPPLEKNKITDTEKSFQIGQLNIFSIINDNFKIEAKNRETNIEAGYKCTLFNKYIKKDTYDINYNYYIKESYKLINIIK